MPNFGLQRDWKQFLTYETFERVASRIVMIFIAIIIVYTLILMAMTLFDQIKFSSGLYRYRLAERCLWFNSLHIDSDRIQSFDRIGNLQKIRRPASAADCPDNNNGHRAKSDPARFCQYDIRTAGRYRRGRACIWIAVLADQCPARQPDAVPIP